MLIVYSCITVGISNFRLFSILSLPHTINETSVKIQFVFNLYNPLISDYGNMDFNLNLELSVSSTCMWSCPPVIDSSSLLNQWL
jgi:hypothetical protein